MERQTGPEQPDPVSGLTGAQVRALEAQLRLERAKLEEKMRAHVGTAIADSSGLADEMDVATRAEEQAYLLKLADKEDKLLREIDDALARVEAGTYGVCEGTGEPIGHRRLAARPWARHSIEHKEELERVQRDHAKS